MSNSTRDVRWSVNMKYLTQAPPPTPGAECRKGCRHTTANKCKKHYERNGKAVGL